MNEIETKILEIDREEVENKLIRLGAEKIFEGELNALFFDILVYLLTKVQKNIMIFF